MAEARRHAVTAIAFDGLNGLPDSQLPPDSVLLPWLAETEAIERESRRFSQAATELTDLFRQAGFEAILLKGPRSAAHYPRPYRRSSGDLDFYVPALPDLVIWLKKMGYCPERHSDGAYLFSYQGIPVELHPRPLNLYTGVNTQASGLSFELLSQIAHVFSHVIGHGVGLRHILDLAMLCRSLEADPAALAEGRRLISENQLSHWASEVSSLLKYYFAIPEAALPLAENLSRRKADRLLRRVLADGNFTPRNNTRLKTAMAFLRRLPYSLSLSPRHTLATLRALTLRR